MASLGYKLVYHALESVDMLKNSKTYEDIMYSFWAGDIPYAF